MSALNIAAYCRVSTDKEDQLNSLETQKDFFIEYAEKNGHNLVRLYADEGLSGTKVKHRKQFQKMMEQAELGMFQMVVVKDISRLARNTVDLLQSVRRLKALGIETLFLTANMTSMGNSEFILTVYGALAQEESANMSKRVKFGKRMNAEKGKVPNIVYGYDKTIGDYFHLTINEEEAAVIRQMYQWYLVDGYGGSKIANLLNQRGLKTKRGCDWNQNAVCRILTNPLYTGKIINGKQEVSDFLTSLRTKCDASDWMVVERLELRIIEERQFEQACRQMASRGRAFHVDRKRHSNKHLFSTLIQCKECGWSFRRVSRTYQNTYVRWVCSKHNGQGVRNCPNAACVDENELIAQLNDWFCYYLENKSNGEQVLRRELRRLCKSQENGDAHCKTLQTRLSRLEKQREKYLELYTDDLITRQELNQKLSGCKEEITCLQEELRQLKTRSLDSSEIDGIAAKAFRNPSDFVAIQHLNNAQLKLLIEKIEVDKDGNVDVYLNFFMNWKSLIRLQSSSKDHLIFANCTMPRRWRLQTLHSRE